MRTKTCLIIISLILMLPWSGCSNGADPATPSDPMNDSGIETPDITLPSLPRNTSDSFEIPADPEYSIELNPAGEAAQGTFTFGDTPIAGIEVRINDEVADFTDEEGNFEIPSILDGDHTISFAINDEIIHSQPYSPVSRFAQDSPNPGPGIMAGTVFDENGPVAGALIIAAKGDNYAYTFSGQYGQYYLTGAPAGNAIGVCLAEFHNPVFDAVNIPGDGTPLEKDFFVPMNMSMGKIYGRVVSPNIGAVPHAIVTYEAPGVFRADLSNIFGIFELEAIPVGIGLVKAERIYFYPVQGMVQIHAGLNTLGVILHAIEQSSMHGYVLNEQGEPINGALVRLAVFHEGNPYPMVYGKLSGPGGYFYFDDLLPGNFLLQSFLPGLIPAGEAGFIPPGSLIEEILVMHPGTGGHCLGWVENSSGEPVEDAVVQLRYIGTDIGVAAATDENGFWQLYDIPYGACEIRVESAEYLPKSGSWDVLPNENQGLVVILHPPIGLPTGELSGVVADVAGVPIPNALVWIYNLANPGLSFMDIADENGEYYFPNPIVGTNGAWALAEGFSPDNGYVEIALGELAELNFALMPE